MARTDSAPTAAILTLGCKLNIADSERMAQRLRQAGWQVTDRVGPADAVIVNSCSVTHVADQKSRHLLRQARKRAPDATIAFTGCMVETAEAVDMEALAADLVYRQQDQLALAERLIERHGRHEPAAASPVAARLKTRAFVSAQEGCNDVCAFCIIPRTRGRERSKPIDVVVAEARQSEAEGARELVVTGTQLGAYGRDQGGRALTALVQNLLERTSFPRIRISSIQPQDLSPALIDLWRDERLCRHFHLALQSGSETVLQRMRRRYTLHQYAVAVAELRDAVPDVAITTDVIVGFPGETDAEFEETLSFCRRTAFAALHVFPYSQRTGTAAVKLPGQVPDVVRKERVSRLIALGEEASAAYRRGFIGRTEAVLWETLKDGNWEGLTDTYIRVRTPDQGHDMHNRIGRVRLTAAGEDGLLGEIIES